MTTQYNEKPNWFAASWFGQFLASSLGRAVRVVAGLAIIAIGLSWIGAGAGHVVAVRPGRRYCCPALSSNASIRRRISLTRESVSRDARATPTM